MAHYTYALQKGTGKAQTVSQHRFERAAKSSAWYGARITIIETSGHSLKVLVHPDILATQAIASDDTLHAEGVQAGQDKRKRPNGKRKAQAHIKPHTHIGKYASMTKTEATPRSGLHYERAKR